MQSRKCERYAPQRLGLTRGKHGRAEAGRVWSVRPRVAAQEPASHSVGAPYPQVADASEAREVRGGIPCPAAHACVASKPIRGLALPSCPLVVVGKPRKDTSNGRALDRAMLRARLGFSGV